MSASIIQPQLYVTRCRLCGKPFEAEPFIPLIGESRIDKRRAKMLDVLLNHLATSHLDQMKTLAIVAGFQFSDPQILAELETARWQIHQQTAKNFLTDEVLRDQLSAAGFDEEQIKTVLTIRDMLTETGEHAAIRPAAPSSPIIQ